MKVFSRSNRKLGYLPIALASSAAAVIIGFTPIASRVDNYIYDWVFNLAPPPSHAPRSIVVALDDATYMSMGGVGRERAMLASALDIVHAAHPKVVAIDVLLADEGDPVQTAALAQAICRTPKVVLATDIVDGVWQDPAAPFRRCSAALGHDKADENSTDGVTRAIPLEERGRRERHWSLALAAFALARGQRLLESPDDLTLGAETIPAARRENTNRSLRVAFATEIPQLSLHELMKDDSLARQCDGKAVFIGVTSLSAARDRVRTPAGEMPGVEVHANLYETLAGASFVTEAPNLTVILACLLLAALQGLGFALFPGWRAYLFSFLLLACTVIGPFFMFRHGIIYPYIAVLGAVSLSGAGSATYEYFFARRDLRRSDAAAQRYRQVFQWVTHEMRTPLTAIQGSSELMGRYNLPEEKRNQIALMINSESKRLARMIQTFLDVERLSAGHMELKRERFPASDILEICLERARPLAEKKEIQIRLAPGSDISVFADRELLEYAIYNLLTNAVKYSPPQTQIQVSAEPRGRQLSISVQDQGIGIDPKDLKQVFRKFYRTRRAEASGEVGTGLGLSIVEQIVDVHGGVMQLTSEVGKGSCFTIILPAQDVSV